MPAIGQECECQEYDQIVVLAKSESVYSDDSGPTPAEAIVFTGRPTVALEGENIERDLTKPYWGNTKHQTTAKFVTISGTVEVAGPGAAGNVPGAAVLLRACGLGETITAGVDVQYDPASENIESASLYFYQDKDLWKVTGVRGNAKLMASAGEFAKWEFTLTGLFSLPEDNATPPTLPAPSDADPLVLNFQNTPTGRFFGRDVDISNFELDLGNVISKRNKPGCYSVQITGRNPSGSITMCAPRINVQDVRALANEYATGEIEMVHGVDDGEIFETKSLVNQLDLNTITDTDLGDNEKGLQASFKPLPTNGDDEFYFKYR